MCAHLVYKGLDSRREILRGYIALYLQPAVVADRIHMLRTPWKGYVQG